MSPEQKAIFISTGKKIVVVFIAMNRSSSVESCQGIAFKQTPRHAVLSWAGRDVLSLEDAAQVLFPAQPLLRSAGAEVRYDQIMGH